MTNGRLGLCSSNARRTVSCCPACSFRRLAFNLAMGPSSNSSKFAAGTCRGPYSKRGYLFSMSGASFVHDLLHQLEPFEVLTDEDEIVAHAAGLLAESERPRERTTQVTKGLDEHFHDGIFPLGGLRALHPGLW